MKKKNFNEIDEQKVRDLTKEQIVKLGKTLKFLRVKNNLTLNDVSFYLFSSISTVEKLEQGKLKNLTLLTLMKFADFYKIDIKDLFI